MAYRLIQWKAAVYGVKPGADGCRMYVDWTPEDDTHIGLRAFVANPNLSRAQVVAALSNETPDLSGLFPVLLIDPGMLTVSDLWDDGTQLGSGLNAVVMKAGVDEKARILMELDQSDRIVVLLYGGAVQAADRDAALALTLGDLEIQVVFPLSYGAAPNRYLPSDQIEDPVEETSYTT